MSESPFGPMRNQPRWDPNDMLALDDETQWQSIRDALGDTVCLDTGVIHEASFEERQMAQLVATFPALAEPTNTVALQTAPIVVGLSRMQKARVVLVVVAAVWAGTALLTALGVWAWSR